MNNQLEFKFMKDLLTPMELIIKLMREESSREFDMLFLKKIKELKI
jgi:hypothetical protein